MDPAQMEGFIVNYYEYHFLYITGIEHVESKSIQGVGLARNCGAIPALTSATVEGCSRQPDQTQLNHGERA
jgi:hypothetical protein